MVIDTGDKVHVAYRALYESSTRRHFVGEVVAAEGAFCRISGFAFVHDPKLSGFEKKAGKRITIMNLVENGYVVNVIEQSVDIDIVVYKYESGVGLVVTDGKDFSLNINEFGSKY